MPNSKKWVPLVIEPQEYQIGKYRSCKQASEKGRTEAFTIYVEQMLGVHRTCR